MVRSWLRRTLVIGLATFGLAAGCSSEEPDLGPNDAEALATAAALTIEDFPDGDWQMSARSSAEIYPPPEPDATPFPFPVALSSCREFLDERFGTAPTPPPFLSSAHGRSFSDLSSDATTFVAVTVQVFATQDDAEAILESSTEVDSFADFMEVADEDCRRAFAAGSAGIDDGSAIIVQRERDLGFEIRGVEIRQVKMTLSSSAGVETNVSTVAIFSRGHIVANYQANETTEGALDHERLIRTFIQRVTDAQLADRALAED